MANAKFTDEEALRFHARGKPGKLEVHATKPMATQRDLSLAYSPGVAAPVRAIAEDPASAYDYTAKGNMVAVMSNGSAILGLGNLGPLASKPVMEGKAVLFKRFADVDAFDLEIDTQDVDEFINCARYLGPAFGGVNLEDIKAPDCFIIEQRLREIMDIPVFHDDQHGTAIIALAGLINALHLTDREPGAIRMVVNGAGAAGVACLELVKAMGVPHANVTLCDTRGVVYQGREAGMNQWKSAHAIPTEARTLEEAMAGADVAFGLSARGAFTSGMIASMAKNPIIFAMANPDPEITPEEAKAVREDAIVATGRSDYPNQVNNVLGFPYIFRGALDVRASSINDEMKIAAARALAELAREDVPDEVAAAYGKRLTYGREYIIPAPFDPRLITKIPAAVAHAAMASGVARAPIIDMGRYEAELAARLDPTASALHVIFDQARAHQRRVVFAEGEEEQVIRAAVAYRQSGFGEPVVIGREERVRATMERIGLHGVDGVEVVNAANSSQNEAYFEHLYERLQRRGYLARDCQRMVNQDRNVFGACMVALGDADAMVTGVTRSASVALADVRRVIDPRADAVMMGLSIVIARGRTVLVADTLVNDEPTPEDFADIATQSARFARRLSHEPRVAFVAHATFGHPQGRARVAAMREAVEVLDGREVDFEYDGEMAADVALNRDLMALYPFCRLSGPANVIVMPALNSATSATKFVQELGGGAIIGPILMGLDKSVQIAPMGATVSDLVALAAIGGQALDRG